MKEVVLTVIALGRVLEERARTSPTLRRWTRGALAFAARHSREARDYVRVRVRPVV